MRPHHAFGTVELRICDAQTRGEESFGLAGLIAACVVQAAQDYDEHGYDGALGPGTGSFLVFALVGVLGYGFLEASGKAKLANFATNLAALVVFVPQGAVIWKVAAVLMVCNVAGGYLGARLAVARGNRFIRIVFIVVVSAFVVRIGWDTWQQLID